MIFFLPRRTLQLFASLALLASLGSCDCRHRMVLLDDAAQNIAGDAPTDAPADRWRSDHTIAAMDYIYVVDVTRYLRRYHPAKNTFSTIGRIDCPTTSSPRSMAVDRSARAWVLHHDNHLYMVDTTTAKCRTTSFRAPGYELSGMGFVAAPTGDRLYVIGGEPKRARNLIGVNPTSLQTTIIGQLHVPGMLNPELTGTRDGRLFAYFPGEREGLVAEVDPQTAKVIKRWPLAGPGDKIFGWAFGHWGGMFYIFVTANDSRVIRLDPVTGQVKTMQRNLPFVVVGAGVSTLAPTTFPHVDPPPIDGGPG